MPPHMCSGRRLLRVWLSSSHCCARLAAGRRLREAICVQLSFPKTAALAILELAAARSGLHECAAALFALLRARPHFHFSLCYAVRFALALAAAVGAPVPTLAATRAERMTDNANP